MLADNCSEALIPRVSGQFVNVSVQKGKCELFHFLVRKEDIEAPKLLDEIERAVCEHLKPLGFRKHGRTLHRFVSGDISQVVHFQLHLDSFCVNLGIRVPECAERTFHPQGDKKYYREEECTIRSRLGCVSGKREMWFDLRKNSDRTIGRILTEIDKTVMPIFDLLSSRDAILAHRREYPLMDFMSSHLILLDECVIYGHMSDSEMAKNKFDAYYRLQVEKYKQLQTVGHKHYLKKGERVVYMGQDITAKRSGYVTLYGSSRSHIDYLDTLAAELGLR